MRNGRMTTPQQRRLETKGEAAEEHDEAAAIAKTKGSTDNREEKLETSTDNREEQFEDLQFDEVSAKEIEQMIDTTGSSDPAIM